MARQLTPGRRAEADRIERRRSGPARGDLREPAEMLASRSGDRPLGAAEFEVRDRMHRIGARAIEAAPEGRGKGATAG